MAKNVDITSVAKQLNAEFDELIDEREKVRAELAKLQARAGEIDRKLSGLQQSIQGFAKYFTAQEEPTSLTKKTTTSLAHISDHMARLFSGSLEVEGPVVAKTLTECCRDILRAKGGWMSPVQVRQALLAAGFDFSEYKSNPLSSIHTTLKRLAMDELETITSPEGQVYRWKQDAKK
jgi:hypothetical protein